MHIYIYIYIYIYQYIVFICIYEYIYIYQKSILIFAFFSTFPFHLHRHPHHVASGGGFRWKGYVLKNAKIRILFWAMAARNWGSGSPQLFIKFRCWANRLQTSLVLFWRVKTFYLPRITFHLIRLLGESLSNNFTTVLECEKNVCAEDHFSHNSGAQSWGLPGGQGGPNFSSFNSVAGKKMFVAPNFFPPLIKAPTLALQAEPKLGPPRGAGRPQVYGV